MDNRIINLIEKRALCKSTQTDFAEWGCPDLPPPASLEVIEQAEQLLGRKLWHEHRQLLTSVANGYFGPGNGLLHLSPPLDENDEQSLINIAKTVFREERMLPICDWGCGMWSCIDCESGKILSSTEYGTIDSGLSFSAFLERWAQGIKLFGILFDQSIINPKI